jgi:hypothetical protein
LHGPSASSRGVFSRALHKIKAAADLSGADRVVIHSNGSVTDEQGETLGKLHDDG